MVRRTGPRRGEAQSSHTNNLRDKVIPHASRQPPIDNVQPTPDPPHRHRRWRHKHRRRPSRPLRVRRPYPCHPLLVRSLHLLVLHLALISLRHKSPTTPDPTIGIHAVLSALLTQANVDPARIASVTIGTTHFINAVVEQDRARLAPVAVFRLCGPFSRDVPPAIDWPESPTERLRSIVCAHSAFLDGGLEVDGEPIMDVREDQVAEQCALIKAKGIRSVVVNGVFAPVDISGKESQEERVGAWIAKYYPEADVVLSKHGTHPD